MHSGEGFSLGQYITRWPNAADPRDAGTIGWPYEFGNPPPWKILFSMAEFDPLFGPRENEFFGELTYTPQPDPNKNLYVGTLDPSPVELHFFWEVEFGDPMQPQLPTSWGGKLRFQKPNPKPVGCQFFFELLDQFVQTDDFMPWTQGSLDIEWPSYEYLEIPPNDPDRRLLFPQWFSRPHWWTMNPADPKASYDPEPRCPKLWVPP